VRRLRLGAPLTTVDPFTVFDRDGWRCRACGTVTPKELRGTIEPNAPELDHVVPLAMGGGHTYKNTQLLCRSCNRLKSDKHPSLFVYEAALAMPV
jgi:5-methylcytosine-specific restriction endonuclease McrA